MKKICCVIFGKYREFKNPKISYIFGKTLVLSIICSKCWNDDEKIFKEDKSIEILIIIGLSKIYNYFKSMAEDIIGQEFRLKNIDKRRNYFLEKNRAK